jgi:hypothetical protein
VVSLDPERGVILMIPLPVKPYSAEKLLVNTVTSFTNPGIANFVLLENVRYYLIHQLNKKYKELAPLILTFGDSGKKPVACDTFGKRNKTLVISRPLQGFLEFRLPLVQKKPQHPDD